MINTGHASRYNADLVRGVHLYLTSGVSFLCTAMVMPVATSLATRLVSIYIVTSAWFAFVNNHGRASYGDRVAGTGGVRLIFDEIR